jgi:hypothetical protein
MYGSKIPKISDATGAAPKKRDGSYGASLDTKFGMVPPKKKKPLPNAGAKPKAVKMKPASDDKMADAMDRGISKALKNFRR